jgi:hypothetical protein
MASMLRRGFVGRRSSERVQHQRDGDRREGERGIQPRECRQRGQERQREDVGCAGQIEPVEGHEQRQ